MPTFILRLFRQCLLAILWLEGAQLLLLRIALPVPPKVLPSVPGAAQLGLFQGRPRAEHILKFWERQLRRGARLRRGKCVGC